MGNALGLMQWTTIYDDGNFYATSTSTATTVSYPRGVPVDNWRLEEWSLETQPDCKLTAEQRRKRDLDRHRLKTRALVERIKAAQPPDKAPPVSTEPAEFEEI